MRVEPEDIGFSFRSLTGEVSTAHRHPRAMTGGVPSILRELYRLRLAESENHREVCVLWWVTPYYSVSYNKKMLLKPAEFFTINLAVSDLGMTLSLYPLAVTSSIYHRWLYGKTVCLVYAFCGVLFGICSLTTLTILSTVCCLKVCYPLYGNRFCPDHGRILIACAWAYALVFACSPLAHWGAYGPEPYGTACCIDWQRSNRDSVARSYTVALFLCCYVLPCCVITSAYSQILVTVRESRRAVEQHVSQQTHMGNVQTTIVKGLCFPVSLCPPPPPLLLPLRPCRYATLAMPAGIRIKLRPQCGHHCCRSPRSAMLLAMPLRALPGYV